MTEWPKNPDLRFEGTVEPVGPMNVFNEKLATAAAVNEAIAVKKQYDLDHPPPPPPPSPAAVVVTPIVPVGSPISAGQAVLVDESKYMIDVPKALRRR